MEDFGVHCHQVIGSKNFPHQGDRMEELKLMKDIAFDSTTLLEWFWATNFEHSMGGCIEEIMVNEFLIFGHSRTNVLVTLVRWTIVSLLLIAIILLNEELAIPTKDKAYEEYQLPLNWIASTELHYVLSSHYFFYALFGKRSSRTAV